MSNEKLHLILLHVMLNHFLKIFLRTSLKNPSYTLINILGLAIGMVCAIIAMQWVRYELSFDGFHRDRNRIFQVLGNHAFPAGTDTFEETPGPLAEGLRELPEVEESCRLRFGGGRILFKHGDRSIYEDGVFADASVFDIFSIPLVYGNNANALADIHSIAISETLARKYFQDELPLNNTFLLDGRTEVKVMAVFKDIPDNSTLQFDFILPYMAYARTDAYNNEWGAWTGGKTYVKVYEGTIVEELNQKIAAVLTKPRIWPRWDSNVQLFLFPMSDWRLHSNFVNGIQEGGRATYLWLFSSVAAFILLIACINFMNLATARSLTRIKEIGVRKAVGAARRLLTRQFLIESVVTAFIALCVGLLIVQLSMPIFIELTGIRLQMDYVNPYFWGLLVFLALSTGLVAGSYPALFLSSLKAISVLKGEFLGRSGAWVRKTLVVCQFAISVVMILSALAVYFQIDYMRHKDLGFDRNHVIYFPISPSLQQNFEAFRHQLMQDPAIRIAGRGDNNPMNNFSGIVLDDNAWPGKTKDDNLIFNTLACDSLFVPTMGFRLVEGRNFSVDHADDTANYILNEEAVRQMKLADPLGQELLAPGKGKIVGIIEDFNSTSLKNPIAPIIISMRPKQAVQAFVRYEPDQTRKAVAHIQRVYKSFEPDFPLTYSFLDDTFNEQYRNEILTGKVSSLLTGIAIILSCLGLFGLASFTIERRTKEIGVRKVLGAAVYEILLLLYRDFAKLVAIGFVIACPIGYYIEQTFLSTYAFRTDPGLWIFPAVGGGMLLITLLVVSYHSIRSARTNPAEVLRSE